MVHLVPHTARLHANISIDTYVCISCNLSSEAEKPWLLQRAAYPPPPSGPHNVLHTLALAIDARSSVTSEPELTTEHQLDRLGKIFEDQYRELHDRFDNHEKVMQERMEEMFRLMRQVLASRSQMVPAEVSTG